MSEIRYDKLHDAHVIIAPERLRRPDCDMNVKAVVEEGVCPFCEGNESMTPPEIFARRKSGSFPNETGWQTRVVPNLYKAVQIEAPYQHRYGLLEHWEGFGAHEVIIDTPEHHTSMTQWSVEAVVAWLETLRARVADLRCDDRIAFISLFKNEGLLAGSTQSHSHTQLIGLPIIPKADRERHLRSYEHYKSTGIAMMESMLLHEEEDDQRIITTQGAFTAFCPYASAYPFEVMISSKKVLGQIDTLSRESIDELAPLLLSILKKMKQQLGCSVFNLSIVIPPLQQEMLEHDMIAHVDEICRFAIRIMPRLYRHGGLEASTGVFINPVAPELAAKLLRESSDD
jgi:UDPglucose--hexose-1-phosphate uridylyltransferase